MRFHEAAGLNEAAIRRVQQRVRRRVLKAFVRWGLLEPEARDEMLEWARPDRRSALRRPFVHRLPQSG